VNVVKREELRRDRSVKPRPLLHSLGMSAKRRLALANLTALLVQLVPEECRT
jgi:hypothetical protein